MCKLSNYIKEDRLPVLGTCPIRPELVLEFNGTEPSSTFSISNATSLTIHRSDTNETKTLTGTSSVSIPASDIPQMGILTVKDVVLGDGSTDHGSLELSYFYNLVAVHSYGDLPFTRLSHSFCSNLTSVPDRIPPTVTDLNFCFGGCSEFNDPNISQWNVSNVTDMNWMFQNATNFNQPLNNWNVSSVTNMSYMFSGATSFNQDINNWDTSKVTKMNWMFNDATSFNQPLNNWNVIKVTNMSFMFYKATSFNQDISNWNVSSVTNMYQMFRDATSFNQDISNWNTSKVTNMYQMFRDATSFNQDISSWCVSKIPSKPTYFDTNTPNWRNEYKPYWGTCPIKEMEEEI